MPRAVVMLSGGLDSATVAAFAVREGYEVSAISFDYGQRHRVELEAAARVAAALRVADHRTVKLDLRAIGGSALTSDVLAVPKDALAPGVSGEAPPIPVTYVPARNTVFLGIALGLAEVLGAFDLFFGANALDYSGYPDCRPEFVEAFERLANVATRAAVEGRGRFRIHAPLLHRTKAEIIRLGADLGLDFALTHSCYDPVDAKDVSGVSGVSSALACGRCDSCALRRRGFAEAGVPDVTRYA